MVASCKAGLNYLGYPLLKGIKIKLHFVELAVKALLLHQLLVVAKLCYPAMVNHGYFIGIAYSAEAVGYYKTGAAFH